MVEDEIVSPGLRGVECYVLTTRAHPEERSGEWRTYSGGVGSERFPRGLSGFGRDVSRRGLAWRLS